MTDLTDRLHAAAHRMNECLVRDRLGVSVAMNHRTRMSKDFNPVCFADDFCISTLALLNAALGAEMNNRKGPHLSYKSRENGDIDRFIVCAGIDCNTECPMEQPAGGNLTEVHQGTP